MGRKTGAVKSRARNSRRPSNPSPISLPLRHEDEANEEYHVDGKNHGASKNTGSSQNKDNNNDDNVDVDGNGDVYVDINDKKADGKEEEEEEEEEEDEDDDDDDDDDGDNVLVPDSVEEVDRCAGRNRAAGPSGDCIVVDWLEGEFCIICNSRYGHILVCSENGCPVASHEACMNCEPKFDDMGKFYCPYCWYKREVAKTKELRMKVMLAKNELSDFMFLRRDGGNEEKQEGEIVNMKGASKSTRAREVNSGDCGIGLNDDDKETTHHDQDETRGVESISKEKSDEQSTSRANGFDNVENGERILEEDIENSSDSEDEIDEDRWQIRPSSSRRLGIVEDAFHASTKEMSDVVGVLEENHGKKEKEEQVLPNAVGATMAAISRDAKSKVPTIESFEFLSPDLDAEISVMRQKRVKQTALKAQPLKVVSPNNSSFRPSTRAKYVTKNQEGKAITAKNSVQCQESAKRHMSPTVGTEKRRRLNWTSEEEDMLKELVRRFSTKVNKNIPWRKILEHGNYVFHATRTPVDLKDKWKNIMAKETPKK